MASVSSKTYLVCCSFEGLHHTDLLTQMMDRRDIVCENRLVGHPGEVLWSHFHQYKVHWSCRSVESCPGSRRQSCFNTH